MAEVVAKLKKFGANLRAVFREKDFSYDDETKLTPFQKFAHFCYLAAKGFVGNRGMLRAAALTYTTLLALVPLLAVAFSISTALLATDEGHRQIRDMIDTVITRAAPQLGLIETDEGERNRVAVVIHSAISEIRSGALGVVSAIFLIFVAISLLSTIEGTLNDMWGVKRGRTFLSRVVLYWALVTLGPIFMGVALALGAGPNFGGTRQWLEGLPYFREVFFQATPLLLLVLLFTLFFKWMPNTHVQWRAALTGALVTGVLLHLNNTFSSLYFMQVLKQHRIYGSLGILPVFLLGLYVSWVMVLLGAQISYTFQNRRAYFLERQAESVNEFGREFIALRAVTLLAQRFQRGEPPLTAGEIGEHLCVPSRLIRRIAEPLIKTHLLVEVAGPEPGYLPGRPLDQISYQDVLDAIRGGEGRELLTREDTERDTVRRAFDSIRTAERSAGDLIVLEDLVEDRSDSKSPASPQPPAPQG